MKEGFTLKDEAGFWKSFAKQRNGQVEGFVGKRKAMEEAVRQIVAPTDSQEMKLRKLYDRGSTNPKHILRAAKNRTGTKREKPAENVEEVLETGSGTACS